MGRSITVSALTLVAAGVMGGGFALAISQDTPQQPVELHQVVATETATTIPTTATATATASTTTAPRPTHVTAPRKVATVAPRVVSTSPETEPQQTTPPHLTPIKPPPPGVTLVTETGSE